MQCDSRTSLLTMPQHDHLFVDVSICICTRNRPESLADTLESIRGSSTAPGQVVVADDSTDERTRDLVRTGYPDVLYCRGSRRGLGANRNTAAAAATGERILFLDDDCRLDVDFLATALASLGTADDPARTIITGCETNNHKVVIASDQDFLGFQSRSYRPSDVMHSVVINATLFPRHMFDQLSFDEKVIYGFDEVDLTSRAVAAGYTIIACLEAVNHHSPSPTNRDYYGVHAQASRLYVTFKRYRFTQGRPVKAAAFLAIAILHVAATMTRDSGLAGLRAAREAVLEALAAITQSWRAA